MKLETTLKQIKSLNETAMIQSRKRWDDLAKPLKGLGALEEILIRAAGITGEETVKIDRKALIVMCADNGVVAEGVSQTDSSVTRVVTDNFTVGKTTACIMAKCAGVQVFPIDIGVNEDTAVFTDKVAYGTRNMVVEPAMSREQAVKAIEVGIRAAFRCKEQGYGILLTGEMGIGNTTTSSAVASILLGVSPAVIAGRGAGLSQEGLNRKQEVIVQAIAKHQPDAADPVDVLAKVGGLDIAGLTGVFLGGAACSLPVVIDGFIAATAALLAVRLQPLVRDYLIPSHISREPGMQRVMEALGLDPLLHCGMNLGEGTGAVALMPLLDMALSVYQEMETFEAIEVEPYKTFTEEKGGIIC